MPNNDKAQIWDRCIQLGLFAVAAFCLLAAILHGIWPDRVDDKTAMFLGLAAAVLIIREISTIEFPGVKILRREFKEELARVDQKVNVIETSGLLPGREPAAKSVAGRSFARRRKPEDGWFSDPNNGKFGGSPEANGRKLEAEIVPAAGSDSAACHIHVKVISTDPARPLQGKVTLYMHPTFGKWQKYDVPVENRVAEDDEITAWGAFTIGAVADDGATRLELDLMAVPGGTKKFYQQ